MIPYKKSMLILKYEKTANFIPQELSNILQMQLNQKVEVLVKVWLM